MKRVKRVLKPKTKATPKYKTVKKPTHRKVRIGGCCGGKRR